MEMTALCEILAEVLRVDRDEVSRETTIAGDLDADSLDLYQVLQRVEERLEIRVSARDFFAAETVRDLLEVIQGGSHERS